ncbi:MAG: DUF1801 domain-containing protein [Pyrinomonadaceae bacterium]
MSLSKEKYGTFDDLVAGLDPEIEQICRGLRELILRLDPDAVEVVRLGDNAASFGLGPKKMSEAYAYIMPKAAYVNLGFYNGAALADPAGLIEGTGKRLRHVKVYSTDEVAQPAIRQLLEAAKAERRQALDHK